MKRTDGYSAFMLLIICAVILISFPVYAQKEILTQETYLEPPDVIKNLVLNENYKNVTMRNLSPDGENFLIAKPSGIIPIDVMAKPFYVLGEIEFDYTANRLRRLTTRYSVGFDVYNWKEDTWIQIQMPRNCTAVTNAAWSPDGTQVAYYALFDDKTEIWVANVSDGKSKRVTKTPVLATMITNFEWTADGQNILTVLVPENRGPEPQEPAVATEPKVRVTNKKTPTRTYPFLLQTVHDKNLLEYYSTGQLAMVTVRNSRVKNLGEPAMFRSFDLSPDGLYVQVNIMQKPFSYVAPTSRFGNVDEIWDMEGQKLAEVQTTELREATVGGGRNGDNNKRSISWRPDGSGLSYMEMEPRKRGDSDEEQEEDSDEDEKRMDRVMLWKPPFDENSTETVYESETRISSLDYSAEADIMFMTATEDSKQHKFAVYMNDKDTKYTIDKRKGSGGYRDPNRVTLMTYTIPNGESAVRMDIDGAVFLSGSVISKKPENDAPKPYVERVDVKSGNKTRIFESSADIYENMVRPVDNSFGELVITRESPTMIQDTYVMNLRTKSLRKLTNNTDHIPEISNLKRSYDEITRVDGIKFWSRLVLPENYREGDKIPALIWFYPREYTSQKNYDESRNRYNKNSYPRTSARSWDYFTKLGYAIIFPDCPIIGESGKMNNNYVPDLRNSLWAVIDHYDKMGVIDRDKLGIGGHSYGAFGTANAMIHTPFFKAGIAGDGNYNRTLTPVTFQSERRWFWDAREVYLAMSPMLWVNQLN
ncbi:MAG: prolyl oligopeptidase family serine peptidase, partial [bacterium]|nr:prolyl oligopeptidase family serine peptidase [bacterium]